MTFYEIQDGGGRQLEHPQIQTAPPRFQMSWVSVDQIWCEALPEVFRRPAWMSTKFNMATNRHILKPFVRMRTEFCTDWRGYSFSGCVFSHYYSVRPTAVLTQHAAMYWSTRYCLPITAVSGRRVLSGLPITRKIYNRRRRKYSMCELERGVVLSILPGTVDVPPTWQRAATTIGDDLVVKIKSTVSIFSHHVHDPVPFLNSEA